MKIKMITQHYVAQYAESDEVGRTAAEAAILYCTPDVIRIVLESMKKDQEIDFDIDVLQSIAEDHEQPDNVKDILEEIIQGKQVKIRSFY